MAEAATPITRMMQTPNFNLTVMAVMGFSSSVDIASVKHDVSEKLLRHPRFSSLLVVEDEKRSKVWWKPTKVKIEDHVFEHDLDPELEPQQAERFLEEFTKTLAESKPFDYTKPLWEIHILNMKTTNSNASVVFKIHHSLGDGVSLMSIVLACGRKTSDPEALPVLPTSTKRRIKRREKKGLFSVIWTAILVIYYTLVDSFIVIATIVFLKDSKNPIKGGKGMSNSPKRYVHRILSMDDVRLVKNSMKTTVNDVLFGVTDAALTRYLQRRYENSAVNGEKVIAKNLENLRIRAATVFNMRTASIQDAYEVMHSNKKLDPKTWGNMVSFVLIPLKLRFHEDPLCYVYGARDMLSRKKLSLQSVIGYHAMKFVIRVVGLWYGARLIGKLHEHVSLDVSSVMGPREEMTLFKTPVSYLAPTVSGIPASTLIHFQSFGSKLVVSMAVDEKLVPDPHQLCDDFQYSLQLIKDAVVRKTAILDEKS